jgi:MFS family permease
MTCTFIGSAVGGVVASFLGTVTNFVIDSASFLLSGFCVAMLLRYPLANPEHKKEEKPKRCWWFGKVFDHVKEFVLGMKFLFQHPYLLALALIKSTYFFLWGWKEMILVTFSDGKFRWDDVSRMLGVAKALDGLSAGLVPVLVEIMIPHTPRAMRTVVFCSWFFTILGYGAFFWAPHVSVFLIGCVLAGGMNGVAWVFSTTMIQEVCPNEYMGRVFAFDFGFMGNLSLTTAVFIAGAVVQYLNFSPNMLALVCVCYSCLMALLFGVWYILTWKVQKHDKIVVPREEVMRLEDEEPQNKEEEQDSIELDTVQ